MSAFIGIDLGTTFSAVATLDETGRPRIVHNKDGINITPSCVWETPEGVMQVGEEARKQWGADPDAAAARFKRDMGTSVIHRIKSHEFTPTQLSTFILKKLVADATRELGPIGEAVVTIPANFAHEARNATMAAAQAAGLNVRYIINEPTAAALYYAFESGKELGGIYAVYDLGGGTFDVSIIRVNGQDVEVLATNGVSKLGGDDFDAAMQNLVRTKFREQTGESLEEADFTKSDAEIQKKSLSSRKEVLVRTARQLIDVKRDEFEEAISSYIIQAEMLCEATIDEAGIDVGDITDVFLVGGCTRIPLVLESVKNVFKKDPISSVNVDEVVVLGAALYAAYKGSFSENMDLAFKGMGPLEARITDTKLGEHGDGPSCKAIEVKGLFPVIVSTNLGFITSVLDKMDGQLEPVLSEIEIFQEPETVAYQHRTDVGEVSPNHGFLKWTQIGVVIPEILNPPTSGRRNLSVILRVVDLDCPLTIKFGRQEINDAILWSRTLNFEHYFEEKGYLEAAEHRDQAKALSVQIGMAVAMADGSLDDVEGYVLKEWIVKMISPFSDEKKDHLKSVYNKAMSQSYEASLNGDLSLSDLTEQLNKIAEKSARYETIELCFDVMAADGVADAAEMQVIRRVADALELDLDEIEKLRDQKIIGLDTSVSNQSSVEDLLGIEADWGGDKIKKHLRIEFQKWNNRLNALEEGVERDNAQRMLNMIADARKKYG